MGDFRPCIFALTNSIVCLAKVATKNQTVFFAKNLYHPDFGYYLVTVFPILFIINMVKTFFGPYENIQSVDRVYVFKCPRNFIVQFHKVDDFGFGPGEVYHTRHLVLYQPNIA